MSIVLAHRRTSTSSSTSFFFKVFTAGETSFCFVSHSLYIGWCLDCDLIYAVFQSLRMIRLVVKLPVMCGTVGFCFLCLRIFRSFLCSSWLPQREFEYDTYTSIYKLTYILIYSSIYLGQRFHIVWNKLLRCSTSMRAPMLQTIFNTTVNQMEL